MSGPVRGAMMHVEVGRLGRTATLVVCRLGCGCVALGVLLAVGWLQPRLNRELPAAPSTRAPAASRVTTSPTVVTTSGPQGSPGIRKIADTAPVDDIAVTPRSVWIAAGGLVVRVDPRSRRRVVVPGIEQTEPPVVQLTAGAVWATTTAGQQLLRIDPRTVRLAASLKVPAHGVAADGRGVWVVCCQVGARGQLTRVDPVSGRIVAVIRLPGNPRAVGVGPSGVWVCDAGAGLAGRPHEQPRRRHYPAAGQPPRDGRARR
jgi:hypothetical protein